MTRRTAWALGFVALLLVSALASAKSVSIEDFFREFTDDWMRANPTLATMNLYFTGAEQDRLDRQITSQSLTAKRARTALARRALATLATYPRETLTAEQRLSADLMQWQLQMLVDREPYSTIPTRSTSLRARTSCWSGA